MCKSNCAEYTRCESENHIVCICKECGATTTSALRPNANVPTTAYIKGMLQCVIRESQGIAGWHRNGDVAEWDSFSDLIAWVNAD